MYLARGILNPASREVQRDLADAVHMHRTLMRLFPDGLGDNPRKTLGALHRIDEDRRRRELVLFLQSTQEPDFSRLPAGYFVAFANDLDRAFADETENPQVRLVTRERDTIASGDRFVFRLRANTTKKILTKTLSDGKRQNGKRVPVRDDEQRRDWLSRRAARAGFTVQTVRISEVPVLGGRAKLDQLSFAGAIFDGVLEVKDAALFRAALETGIGPAKAYGFGLLSIRQAQ